MAPLHCRPHLSVQWRCLRHQPCKRGGDLLAGGCSTSTSMRRTCSSCVPRSAPGRRAAGGWRGGAQQRAAGQRGGGGQAAVAGFGREPAARHMQPGVWLRPIPPARHSAAQRGTAWHSTAQHQRSTSRQAQRTWPTPSGRGRCSATFGSATAATPDWYCWRQPSRQLSSRARSSFRNLSDSRRGLPAGRGQAAAGSARVRRARLAGDTAGGGQLCKGACQAVHAVPSAQGAWPAAWQAGSPRLARSRLHSLRVSCASSPRPSEVSRPAAGVGGVAGRSVRERLQLGGPTATKSRSRPASAQATGHAAGASPSSRPPCRLASSHPAQHPSAQRPVLMLSPAPTQGVEHEEGAVQGRVTELGRRPALCLGLLQAVAQRRLGGALRRRAAGGRAGALLAAGAGREAKGAHERRAARQGGAAGEERLDGRGRRRRHALGQRLAAAQARHGVLWRGHKAGRKLLEACGRGGRRGRQAAGRRSARAGSRRAPAVRRCRA